MTNSVKVCYILSYKSPNYVRAQSIVAALKEIDGIEYYEARNSSKGIQRYLQTLWKLVKIRFSENPDIYFLGFRGHEIFPFVRLITVGKKLIFDEMMSPAMSLIEENKIEKLIGTGVPSLVKWLEKLILLSSDLVLTDTKLHKEAIQEFFDLKNERIDYVYVGTDEKKFTPSESNKNDENDFTVFTYSNFLPLHGMEIVAEAATIVDDRTNGAVKFLIAGGKGRENSKNYIEFKKILEEHNSKNIVHKEWLDYSKFVDTINSASLCLGGPFGGSNQARRVITGKTYQFLASGKPTIIGAIEEDVGFEDGVNCYIVEQANARTLADKILEAYKDRNIKSVGLNGRELFEKSFSSKKISTKINKVIEELHGK